MIDELADTLMPIMKSVLENISGRSADPSPDHINTRRVAALAVLAGDGDTLEIGSYFGASAIITALAKKQAGVKGTVYCIDPLDGREQMIHNQEQTTGDCYDVLSGEYWTAETFRANCERNGANIILVQKPSNPFPSELSYFMFTLSYIDGDHWHNTPLADWNNVNYRTEKYIVFDDADDSHPYVMRAVGVATLDPEWKLLFHADGLCAFERVL